MIAIVFVLTFVLLGLLLALASYEQRVMILRSEPNGSQE